MMGVALSYILTFNHVVIWFLMKVLKLYLWSLNPMHLSDMLEDYCYLVSEIIGNSEYLCSAGEKFCSHPTEFLVCVGNRIIWFYVILSHMMYKNFITLTNEIVDRIDVIMFHVL
jgi:hypothetical protein